MKSKTTTCHINKPCHKLDGILDQKAKSNYCASYQEEVLNLMKLSEEEIFKNIAKYQGRCVSIQSAKLKGINSKVKFNQLSKAALLAGAISMLAPSCHRMALANDAYALEKEKDRYASKLLKARPLKKEELDKGYYIIKGRVEDDTKEGLIGAQIAIKELERGVITGSYGEFTLKIPKNIVDNMQFEVSNTGYSSFVGKLQDVLDKEVLIRLDAYYIGYLDVSEILENE